MSEKVVASSGRRIVYALYVFIIVVLLTIIGYLMFRVDAQTTEIKDLTSDNAQAQAQVAAYEGVRCSTPSTVTTVNNTVSYSIESAGYTRTYQVHTPQNYDPSIRYPVILSFDGIEGSGARMEAYSELDSLPALIVYADALEGVRGFTAWQGAPYSLEGEQDIQFVRDVLKTVPTRYCTDSARVFAVGMSNGGSFATIAGCALGDQIRAVASISGAYYTTCMQEQRTPSLLVLHSTEDGQVPFAGVDTRQLPQIHEWVERQAIDRRCEADRSPVVTEQSIEYTWLSCSDDSMVRFVILHNQPHGWLQIPPTVGEVKTTADYIWKFFKDSVYYSYE